MSAAAERLRDLATDHESPWDEGAWQAALAAERRATVERIRERVEELGEWYIHDDHIMVRWIDVAAILGEEAAR